MRKLDMVWKGLRILLGLFFILSTMLVIVQFGGNHPPESDPRAAAFTLALNATGFMNPLLIAAFLIGGVALLSERWAPVGLLVLIPPVVVIACFHWFLTHSYIWGTIWPAWLAAMIWHYRSVYARLWTPPSDRSPVA